VYFLAGLEKQYFVKNIYWTGVSRSGCPTHIVNCFHNTSTPYFEDEDKYDIPIMGGSCISAIIVMKDIQPKPIPCDGKFYLACQRSAEKFKQPRKVDYLSGFKQGDVF